ncbi:Glycosyltransferase-like KOBITO 1 [Capsicum chinense]|nr:Glycosyltransferase-like KOBITO 1 [Capsicum chinense]
MAMASFLCKTCPEFLGISALKKDVLGVFHMMVAQLACGIKVNAPVKQCDLGKKSIMMDQTKAIFNFIRNTRVPNLAEMRRTGGSNRTLLDTIPPDLREFQDLRVLWKGALDDVFKRGMVWDPYVAPNIYFIAIRDGSLSTIFAVAPTPIDGFLGSRMIVKRGLTIVAVFIIEDPGPDSGSPDEVPLDPINMIMHTSREVDVLHIVIWNAAEAGLGKGGPTSRIKKIGFPTCHLCVQANRSKVSQGGDIPIFRNEAKVMKEMVSGVVRGSLDARKSSKNVLLFIKDIAKDFLVPVLCQDLECPSGIAVFAFVLQWRGGGVDDPISRWSPEESHKFPGMDSSPLATVAHSSQSSDCSLLAHSNTPSFPYYKDWKFKVHPDLKPKASNGDILKLFWANWVVGF